VCVCIYTHIYTYIHTTTIPPPCPFLLPESPPGSPPVSRYIYIYIYIISIPHPCPFLLPESPPGPPPVSRKAGAQRASRLRPWPCASPTSGCCSESSRGCDPRPSRHSPRPTTERCAGLKKTSFTWGLSQTPTNDGSREQDNCDETTKNRSIGMFYFCYTLPTTP